jgi:hypothetical protein
MSNQSSLDDVFDPEERLREVAARSGWVIVAGEWVHEDGSRASGQAMASTLLSLGAEILDALEPLRRREGDLQALRALCEGCRACVDQAAQEALAWRAEQVAHGDAEPEVDVCPAWRSAYDWIFSKEVSGAARALADRIGVKIERCDPDTSYREDALVFVGQLEEGVARFDAVAGAGFRAALARR